MNTQIPTISLDPQSTRLQEQRLLIPTPFVFHDRGHPRWPSIILSPAIRTACEATPSSLLPSVPVNETRSAVAIEDERTSRRIGPIVDPTKRLQNAVRYSHADRSIHIGFLRYAAIALLLPLTSLKIFHRHRTYIHCTLDCDHADNVTTNRQHPDMRLMDQSREHATTNVLILSLDH